MSNEHLFGEQEAEEVSGVGGEWHQGRRINNSAGDCNGDLEVTSSRCHTQVEVLIGVVSVCCRGVVRGITGGTSSGCRVGVLCRGVAALIDSSLPINLINLIYRYLLIQGSRLLTPSFFIRTCRNFRMLLV